ncbi:hypothetical protein L6164_028985 [Bauhinia variegata]|uniref:Uncharacterized protein n=1 Tax=Bauhinia variegata TaxID=167791 RepID=A0ACB9L7D8_BAUVA|nr:hypothetical protein L6164_028985 [Bauhinia variegata]
MDSCLCLFKNPKSWMALLALLLIFFSFLLVGFGFLSTLFTSLLVVLSAILFMASNHKAVLVEKLVEEKVLSSEEESSDRREILAANPIPKIETLTEANEAHEEVKDCVVNYSTTSPDLLSESESQDQPSTSEDSEVDWPFRYNNADQNLDYSDGSISDEDSLIEIALPSGHYVGQQKEEKKLSFSFQQKKQQELSAESLFSQRSLMEFLAEFNDMNEEENLIEIDISMGSIKYSRFEIEA